MRIHEQPDFAAAMRQDDKAWDHWRDFDLHNPERNEPTEVAQTASDVHVGSVVVHRLVERNDALEPLL